MRLSQQFIFSQSARFYQLTSLSLTITGEFMMEGLKKFWFMLSKCSQFEYFGLGIDKATIEHYWPNIASLQLIWNKISRLQWPKLQALDLAGFAIAGDHLQQFLEIHKRTLVTIHIANCFFFEHWIVALQSLGDSPNLEILTLSQVGSGLRRIIWPIIADGPIDDLDMEGHEDWVAIRRIGKTCIKFTSV
ncbi:hypothetical protein EK21DRAFT_106558 [Setomelanomma holmii]|uniref:Uncharacterized protein n=1 Tax=Setomelanomma holmii TaxID=210430 RepID=A0A9P4HM13_9PLEO|nr:hypothetical protein EK21DRAFT_106558 [Setomelanomma holmii]